MEELHREIASLFDALGSGEAFDLDAHREAVMLEAETVGRRLSELGEMIGQYDVLARETALLRKALAEECRSRLMLLGDEDADRTAEGLKKLDAGALLERREEILGRFDRAFSLYSEGCAAGDGQRSNEDVQVYAV